MRTRLLALSTMVLLLVLGGVHPALAQWISLGPPVVRADAALTLVAEIGPAEPMDGAFLPAERAAFFLAVDVRGARGNKNGFGLNEFVPYLTVTYRLTPGVGGTAAVRGPLLPFVGRQGLRYGNNLPTPGPGPHVVTVTVEPPITRGFGRHTDMETGVARWWRPFEADWAVDLSRVARR